ncbi:hypothetical protein BBJ28_00022764 [Nothophytophthora sp. Chile5]|nr:hypothetical protein BBJ28_00022764 [Nothophytophthora sp. Chile5]
MAAVAWSSSLGFARAEELCSITPTSYATAKTDYPELAFALEAVEEYSIGAWYTDRLSVTDRATMLDSITSECSEDTRMTIVVYGIPNKDCNAGLSSGGTVSSTADYQDFLQDLTDAVGDRKVLYVVEPDAVGLLAEDGGCGSSAGYLDNLKVAVEALSANANAQLYVDVGYWTLEYESQRSTVVSVITELAAAGTLKGITINTSNYRTTTEVTGLCTDFQTAMGSEDLTCIIDTSRNYNDPPSTEWCNLKTAGIGMPPTSETGVSNLDYFMWIKPPGESDGQCSGSTDSLAGTTAGTFYQEGFQLLWDQGYFVKDLGKGTIAEGDTGSSQTATNSSSQTSDSSASQTTDASASQAATTTPTTTTATPTTTTATPVATTTATETPTATTATPATTTATPTTTTAAPTTTAPAATTATPTTTTATPSQTSSNCKVKRSLRKL